MSEHRITLGTQLRAAAHELQREPLPPQLLQRIQRTLDARAAHRAPRRSWGPVSWAWAGLGTALAAVVAWSAVVLVAPDDATAQAQAATTDGFIPVAASERWRQATQGGSGTAWVVSAELSRAKLAALGLPYDPGRADEPVRAQLLMHGSGDVLAVRFVR